MLYTNKFFNKCVESKEFEELTWYLYGSCYCLGECNEKWRLQSERGNSKPNEWYRRFLSNW